MAKPVGKKREGKTAEEWEGLPPLNRNAAGIEVGSAAHYVAVPAGRDAEAVQAFGSFTADLHRMAQWLTTCEVQREGCRLPAFTGRRYTTCWSARGCKNSTPSGG